MATITRFINPASAAGGNGTTSATSGANRAYSSMTEWDAAEQTDLVSDGDVHVVNCAGSTVDGGSRPIISGWTTGVSNFITISGEVATQTAFDTGRYRIDLAADAYDGLLESTQDYTVLEDLQVQMTNSSAGIPRAYEIAGINQTVRRCSAKGIITGGGFNMGFFVTGEGSVVRACLAYDFIGGDTSDVGFYAQIGAGTDIAFQSLTTHNCEDGFRTDSQDATAQNCLTQDCVDGFVGVFTSGSNNCSDIASDAPGTSPRTGEVLFVDEANDDFTLSASDTVAKEFGVDLSGTFTYDFLNNTWPATWSIGAVIPAAAVGGRIMSSLAYYGGLAGQGGIAGKKGGLAG